jgi:predicted nucleic acid-binding protein
MFPLDTAAVSELDRPNPNQGVVDWFASVDWLELRLSAITIAETWQGIVRLPASKKRRALEVSCELLPDRFPERILPVDFQVGVRYGKIQGKIGPLPVLDTLIAATALVNHLTVVTRNTSDIARTGARVHDPWI